jgi:glycosyltransferase involved in cell wall biosynthesis
MKIGYIMQEGVPEIRKSPLSGPAVHVQYVFNELRELGHQVTLLAKFDGKTLVSVDLENFAPVTTNWIDRGPFHLFERAVRRIQFEMRLPYVAFFESLRFASACRQVLADCDIYYERMGWMGFGGVLASRWLGIPLIWEVNGDHISEMELLGNAPSGAQLQLSSWLTLRAVRQPAHIIATGEGWRQRFIQRWEVDPSKVTVIENGSEVVSLIHRDQLACFSNYYDPQKPVIVLYIGGFEPWHGLNILLQAVARAVSQRSELRLILVGSGSELAEMNRLIRELKLETRVKLTGQLDFSELLNYLIEADIGVSPYCGRVEYSGLKLLDYKAAGLAIIASGENGQPSVIRHGQTGWIVPPCDVDALSKAIVTLAKDTNLRRKLGQQARIEAETCHKWRHTAEQIIKIFSREVKS